MKSIKRKLLLTIATLSAISTISANDGYPPEYVTAPADGIPFTAAVKSHGKWGAIDEKGQTVIPLSYDRIGLSLSSADVKEEDLADGDPGRQCFIEVEQNGLRGFYNRKGTVIVPISYESRSIWKEGALRSAGRTRKSNSTKKMVRPFPKTMPMTRSLTSSRKKPLSNKALCMAIFL